MTILGAMSLRRIVASMTIEEATDGDIFLAHVEHMLCPALQPGDVAVMDNLSSHKSKAVRKLIEKVGADVLYLPLYSPDLNPIEEAWSKLKQLLRCAKARTSQALEEASHSRIARLPCCLPPSQDGVGVLICRFYKARLPRPLMPLADASRDISRCPPQDSRSGWSRWTPFPQGSCIPDNMPVYPGAP